MSLHPHNTDFRPIQQASLAPKAKVVRSVLEDARGFYRTRGMSQQDIRREIARSAKKLEAFDGQLPTLGCIHRQLKDLRGVGFAVMTKEGMWRRG